MPVVVTIRFSPVVLCAAMPGRHVLLATRYFYTQAVSPKSSPHMGRSRPELRVRRHAHGSVRGHWAIPDSTQGHGDAEVGRDNMTTKQGFSLRFSLPPQRLCRLRDSNGPGIGRGWPAPPMQSQPVSAISPSPGTSRCGMSGCAMTTPPRPAQPPATSAAAVRSSARAACASCRFCSQRLPCTAPPAPAATARPGHGGRGCELFADLRAVWLWCASGETAVGDRQEGRWRRRRRDLAVLAIRSSASTAR